jgi:hypothetical protein
MIKKQEVEVVRVPNPDFPADIFYVVEFDESGVELDGHWENPDGQQWTEAELSAISPEIEQKFVTTYTYVDGELANDSETPAIETVLTDADDAELATVFKEFSHKNVEYRADGPTSVSGDSRKFAVAEYNWGSVAYDIALEGHLAKGLISQAEHDEAIDKYNNSLVKEADLSNPGLVSALFSSERAVDFADDCIYITDLLAREGLPSLGGGSDSGSSGVYDSGWQTIDGQQFRRVDFTIFGQGTVSTPDVADLTGSEFAPTHPISVSAHYEADKTISNPVHNDVDSLSTLKINSNNGQPVVWSGSWSVTSTIPGTATNVINLTAEPSDTSVVLTWDVE